jgi:outer membrane protein TolC
MIQVTLTFQSLSAALHALREIPESTLNGALTDITPAAEAPAPAAPKPTLAVVAPAAAPARPTAKPEELPAPVAVEYPQLQAAVLKLAARDREATVAIAKSFGVATFKELDKSRWGDAYGAVTEKLGELETVQ